MTLKEKFEQWFINDEEDEHYEGMVDKVAIEHERIAEEFAIGFLNWYNTSQECETYLRRNYPKNITMGGEHHKRVLEVYKELLEIYKKEKEL